MKITKKIAAFYGLLTILILVDGAFATIMTIMTDGIKVSEYVVDTGAPANFFIAGLFTSMAHVYFYGKCKKWLRIG